MKRRSRRLLVWLSGGVLFLASLGIAFVWVARANDVTPAFVWDYLGYSVSRIGKTPRPAPPPAETRDERWRQDLAYLAAELPRLHADAFHTTPRDAFQAHVAEVDARIPRLSDDEIVVELMRIISLVGDGHTTTWTWTERFAQVPLALTWLEGRLYVAAAGQGYEELVGAQVERIGDATVEDALEAVREITSYDSEGGLLVTAARLLTRAEVLAALGLQPTQHTGTWSFLDRHGSRIEVELAAVPPGEPIPWGASIPTPTYRQRAQEDFWWQALPEGGMVYLKVHRCRDREGFRAVAAEVLAAVDDAPAAALVVDLRSNGGGNEAVLAPLLAGIKTRGLGPAGRLWVLTNLGTYSSATGNAASLRALGARSAGEPTGDGLDGYGEVRRFTLPNSGVEVQYSTRYWRRSGSEAPLQPELLVRPSIDDVLAGRDPVLERVAEEIRGR